MTLQETFRVILKEAGYSHTAARTAVFEALLDQEPLSMAQLVEKAAGVDRASVYRAVDLFEQLGIAQRLHAGWKYKIELTDRFAAHHHHLTCLDCGRTTPINGQQLESFIVSIAHENGFTPTTHQIEIQGRCANCITIHGSPENLSDTRNRQGPI
ncbi:MAG TPA: Fur family transcriptional regulator [Candidatus Saccharimonadales bacterium]